MSDITTVADVPDDWALITGAHEREHVLEHIGKNPDAFQHGGLFVNTSEGEYVDVIFFPGEVPYLYKNVSRLK